ncbi:sugar dehydrogenase complex small subunit [Variovorax sp. LT1R16]|uniref:sugar dehydrogenase complex small subunit n=1 Tax=Variovorax sp. LT1R16 TaxID=3443728 RepID=UPI003F47A6C0
MTPENSKPSGPPRFTRREAVLAAAAVASTSLLGWPASGVTQPAAAAAATGTAVDAAAVARFFAFSKAITGHEDIDAVTAGRIRDAMVQGDGAFAAHAETLAGLLQPGMAPDALLAAASDAGLRDAALAVVSAWYTGTVTAGPTPTVVAYEQALMYRPVADGLSVPTYCNEGPLWWTAAPPEVGVPTPQQAAQAQPKPPPPPVMRTQ